MAKGNYSVVGDIHVYQLCNPFVFQSMYEIITEFLDASAGPTVFKTMPLNMLRVPITWNSDLPSGVMDTDAKKYK